MGYRFGGPHNKDHSILGSILGFLYFGKLPYRIKRPPFLPQEMLAGGPDERGISMAVSFSDVLASPRGQHSQ